MTDPIPLPVRRLPKQTLHHVWAPKLRRPIAFSSVAQVRLWVMLEANPDVTNYCERPALSAEQETEPIADFWVKRDGTEQWLVLGGDVDHFGLQVTDGSTRTAPCTEIIPAVELDRHRIWIQNWMSLLPYLTTGSHLIDPTFRDQVIRFFDREATLEEAELHFSRNDPVLVRTAVIAGLHGGQLASTDLIESPVSRNTWIIRHRRGDRHAT
jgi:hypothetical protein